MDLLYNKKKKTLDFVQIYFHKNTTVPNVENINERLRAGRFHSVLSVVWEDEGDISFWTTLTRGLAQRCMKKH